MDAPTSSANILLENDDVNLSGQEDNSPLNSFLEETKPHVVEKKPIAAGAVLSDAVVPETTIIPSTNEPNNNIKKTEEAKKEKEEEEKKPAATITSPPPATVATPPSEDATSVNDNSASPTTNNSNSNKKVTEGGEDLKRRASIANLTHPEPKRVREMEKEIEADRVSKSSVEDEMTDDRDASDNNSEDQDYVPRKHRKSTPIPAPSFPTFTTTTGGVPSLVSLATSTPTPSSPFSASASVTARRSSTAEVESLQWGDSHMTPMNIARLTNITNTASNQMQLQPQQQQQQQQPEKKAGRRGRPQRNPQLQQQTKKTTMAPPSHKTRKTTKLTTSYAVAESNSMIHEYPSSRGAAPRKQSLDSISALLMLAGEASVVPTPRSTVITTPPSEESLDYSQPQEDEVEEMETIAAPRSRTSSARGVAQQVPASSTTTGSNGLIIHHINHQVNEQELEATFNNADTIVDSKKFFDLVTFSRETFATVEPFIVKVDSIPVNALPKQVLRYGRESLLYVAHLVGTVLGMSWHWSGGGDEIGNFRYLRGWQRKSKTKGVAYSQLGILVAAKMDDPKRVLVCPRTRSGYATGPTVSATQKIDPATITSTSSVSTTPAKRSRVSINRDPLAAARGRGSAAKSAEETMSEVDSDGEQIVTRARASRRGPGSRGTSSRASQRRGSGSSNASSSLGVPSISKISSPEHYSSVHSPPSSSMVAYPPMGPSAAASMMRPASNLFPAMPMEGAMFPNPTSNTAAMMPSSEYHYSSPGYLPNPMFPTYGPQPSPQSGYPPFVTAAPATAVATHLPHPAAASQPPIMDTSAQYLSKMLDAPSLHESKNLIHNIQEILAYTTLSNLNSDLSSIVQRMKERNTTIPTAAPTAPPSVPAAASTSSQQANTHPQLNL